MTRAWSSAYTQRFAEDPAVDPHRSPSPASFVQRTMWSSSQRFRSSPLFVMALPWRVEGRLDLSRLKRAIGELLMRHPALRTRLVYDQGQLWQVVDRSCDVEIHCVDVSGATIQDRRRAAYDLLAMGARTPIDVSASGSFRVWYLRTADDEGALCFFVHHALCDGWSSQIMIRELAAFYEATLSGVDPCLPQLVEQYADLARTQHSLEESGAYDRDLLYWRSELEGFSEPVSLAGAIQGNRARDWGCSSPVFRLDSPRANALKAVATRIRVSPFSIYLSCLALLLSARTKADDIVVGVPTLNRRDASLHWVGCATNMLPARIRIDPSRPLVHLLQQSHATIRRLLVYGRVPLELILRDRQSGLLAPQLFSVWCQLRKMSEPTVLPRAGVVLSPFVVERGAIQADLDLDMLESRGDVSCEFAQRPALIERAAVCELMQGFSAKLSAFAEPERYSVADAIALGADSVS